MNSARITRLENLFQREISDILMRRIKDPRVKMCTVSHVKISGDLSKAEIFISVIGISNDVLNAMDGIQSAKGYIRSLLGKNIKIKQVPELHFIHDTNLEYGDRMIELIDDVIKKEEIKKSGHHE